MASKQSKSSISYQRVTEIVRSTPEKKLMIFDLIRQVTKPDGQVNYDALNKRASEVNLATVETEAYAREVEEAIRSLRTVKPA